MESIDEQTRTTGDGRRILDRRQNKYVQMVSGDTMAIRSRDRSTVEIRALKGMCRNEGEGLEGGK